MYSPKLLSAFANLTEVIKQGGTALPNGGVMEPELDEWVTFAESMTPIMSPAAELIAELAIVDGRRPKRVLDIAAGMDFSASFLPNVQLRRILWPRTGPTCCELQSGTPSRRGWPIAINYCRAMRSRLIWGLTLIVCYSRISCTISINANANEFCSGSMNVQIPEGACSF